MIRPMVERLGRLVKWRASAVGDKIMQIGQAPLPPPTAEAMEVWRAVRETLPATITPIPDEHLVAIEIASGTPAPTITITGNFGSGSWLFRDRRYLAGAKLQISRGRPMGARSANVIVVLSGCGIPSADLTTTKIKFLGQGGFAAFGYLRRFPGDISIGQGGRLEVGDETSCSGITIKTIGSTVSIGRDCQIGGGTKVLALNAHSIVDLSQPVQPVVMNKVHDITVGDHVWLGEECRLVGGAQMDDGSILGAYSVLGGKVSQNSVAVGNPARVVRTNRTWSRTDNAIDNDAAKHIARSTKHWRPKEQINGHTHDPSAAEI